MVHYVVGFAFSSDLKNVLLIKKQKPDWQKGRYNGIGGKIEKDESPIDAMIREFKEETGVKFSDEKLTHAWQRYAVIKGDDYVLHCFRAFSDEIYDCKTIEAEEVFVARVEDAILSHSLISSCRTLIPMAKDLHFAYCDITHA